MTNILSFPNAVSFRNYTKNPNPVLLCLSIFFSNLISRHEVKTVELYLVAREDVFQSNDVSKNDNDYAEEDEIDNQGDNDDDSNLHSVATR